MLELDELSPEDVTSRVSEKILNNEFINFYSEKFAGMEIKPAIKVLQIFHDLLPNSDGGKWNETELIISTAFARLLFIAYNYVIYDNSLTLKHSRVYFSYTESHKDSGAVTIANQKYRNGGTDDFFGKSCFNCTNNRLLRVLY